MKKKKEENPREEGLKESTKALKYLGFLGNPIQGNGPITPPYYEDDGFIFDPQAPIYIPEQGDINGYLYGEQDNVLTYANQKFDYCSKTYISEGSQMVYIEQEERMLGQKDGQDTSHNTISLPRVMIPDLIKLLEKFKESNET